jgi:hypothetical protein
MDNVQKHNTCIDVDGLLWQYFVCNKNKNFFLGSVIVVKIQTIEYFLRFYLAVNN